MKFAPVLRSAGLGAAVTFAAQLHAQEKLNVPPSGYVVLFNGQDLTGWKGLPLKANPNAKQKEARPYVAMTMPERLKASPEELAEAQKRGDESAHRHWKVADGVLVFDGKGQNLCTAKDYGDFELYCDWKIEAKGDSGIYVRGSPQIQIWDPFNGPKPKTGARPGSGGLFNNEKTSKNPLARADKPIGAWNTFWITIVGDKVTVRLNDQLVVESVTMENFWERDKPLYPKGTIELQNHGNTLYFRNIFIKELEATRP